MQKFAQWHKTKLGFSVFGVVELIIAYSFASLAIDRGNLWWYLIGFIFLVGGVQNIVKLIWKVSHGNKTAKAR